MRLFEKFKLLTRFRQIGIAVLIAHTLAILSLVIHHLATYRPLPKKPIAVRSRALVPLSAPPKALISSAKPTTSRVLPKVQSPPLQASPSKQKPSPKEKPIPKKEKPLPLQNGSSQTKIESRVEPRGTVLEENLFQEMVDRLDSLSIQECAPVSKSALFVPVLPKKVESKAEFSGEAVSIDRTYGEELIAELQNSLDLPEFGEVKAKILIDHSGHVLSCEILDTKSRKNAEFLKKRLPELTFPCFNGYGLTETDHTFTITFRNVEMH